MRPLFLPLSQRSFVPLLILLSMLWGASFMFMRVAAPPLGPIWLIEFRVLIAGLLLLPILMVREGMGALQQHWPVLVLTGALNAALPFSLLAYASISLNAGMTSILNATVPIFGVLLGGLFYGEQLTTPRVIGVLLGFAGVLLLVGLPQDDQSIDLLPVAAGLLAACSYVIAAHLTKRSLSEVSPLAFVAGSQLGAALLLLPLMPFFVPDKMPSATVVGSVVALAVGSTALAYMIFFHLIRIGGPARALNVAYLIPLFAILWGNLLLGEPVTLAIVFGGALILAGTALANSKTAKHSRSGEDTDTSP